MKMNYPLQNSGRKPGKNRSLFVLFLIVLTAGLFFIIFPDLSAGVFVNLAKPVWVTRDFVIKNVFSVAAVFRNKSGLETENKNLKARLDEAKIFLSVLDAYKNENLELKKFLGREGSEKKILASVMSGAGSLIYDRLLIDVGSKDGVSRGERVSSGDFVIGEIEEVFEGFSKVSLYSSSDKIFDGKLGAQNIPIIVKGIGGGNFYAKLPASIAVKSGDAVRFPGLSPKFYGVVSVVTQEPAGTFQSIMFTLPVNLYTLGWVEVLKE